MSDACPGNARSGRRYWPWAVAVLTAQPLALGLGQARSELADREIAAGSPKRVPVGGAIAGTGKALGIDEGLGE